MLAGESLAFHARNNPHGEALLFGDRRLTWRDLNAGANRLANALLGLGLEPGERVVYVLNNCVEFVEIFYGLAKMGGIGAPVLPLSVGREIAHVANDLGAKFIICEASQASAVGQAENNLDTVLDIIGVGEGHPFGLDYARLVGKASSQEPNIKVDPDSVLTIKYTSGTTGVPKGCMRTHRQLLMAATGTLFQIPHYDTDRASIATMMAAGSALSQLIMYVLRGLSMVMLPKFDATRLLEAIERERITVTFAGLTPFERFTFHPHLESFDLSSLRLFSGSSPSGDTRAGLLNLSQQKSFTGEFYAGYGSSEAGGRVTYLLPADCARGLGDPACGHILNSLGREARFCRVECLDEDMIPVPTGEVGEMAVRTPMLFEGYWNRPEDTAKCFRDGWLMTGDLMRKDEDGYCYLSGRSMDMIKSGGINVYPAEVESVLVSHEKIREAAVIGLPDREWGEIVIACVVRNGDCTEGEILEFCRAGLAPHKRPKSISFVDELPRNAIGKIVKKELKRRLGGE